jgi:hypothetical protein
MSAAVVRASPASCKPGNWVGVQQGAAYGSLRPSSLGFSWDNCVHLSGVKISHIFVLELPLLRRIICQLFVMGGTILQSPAGQISALGYGPDKECPLPLVSTNWAAGPTTRHEPDFVIVF